MNNNEKLKSIIDKSIKAVDKTGVGFLDIPKRSILEFLEDNGIKSKSLGEDVYKALNEYYSKLKKASSTKVIESNKSTKEETSVPKRKSVFSKVKRIA